jgi:integrase
MGSGSCWCFFLSGILRMYARTNSLATFESSSARQTRHVFSFRLGSLSGRTAAPLRAMSKARRQSDRTTSALPVAVSWIARTVGPSQVSGARPTFPFRTGSAYRGTMSGGMLRQVRQHRLAHLPAYLPTWLDDTGAPMGVQQKLMRHSQISTTMNVYGNALMEAKREANAAVVSRILRSA